jgi:pimeloyl-ACP methyl ester carboxylesterase
VPEVKTRDGVRLHWEEQGSGPTALLTPYWSMHPSVFDPLEAVLARDFRVVRFDERGTGRSERRGPYDLETGANDLEDFCEATGTVEVAICLVDASNRAVRVAARRPELLRNVLCIGSAPFGMKALEGSESLISSQTVVGIFLQQLDTDYRGAIRAVLAGASTGLDEDGLRTRVQAQMDYAEPDAAYERARTWAADRDGAEFGRGLGDRLHVCLSRALGGADSWFPAADEMEPLVRESFPEAGVSWSTNGIISTPEEIAAVVKSLAGVDVRSPR